MYSPRARALLRSGRYSNVPQPTMAPQGDRHHARPGAALPGALGDPTTLHKVLRGILQPGDKPPARALAQITSGRAGYHLGLAMLCLTQWIKLRWASTGTVPWIWAIPTAHTQMEAGPDTRKDPPPQATALPHLRIPRHPQDPFFFFFVIQVQSHCSRVLRRPAHHTEYHPHPRSRSVGGAAGRKGELWTVGLRLCRIIENVDNTEVVAPHSTPGGGGSVIGGTVRAGANPGHFPRREKQEGFGPVARRRERAAFHSHDSDVGV